MKPNLSPHWQPKPLLNRRDMLRRCGSGFGYIALLSLLSQRSLPAAEPKPLEPKAPHFKPRAKRVIFLFMHGGPSHVDTFDPKPLLTRDHGKPADIPRLPPGLDPAARPKLLRSPFEFEPRGDSGQMISSLFPELSRRADELCIIRSMHTNGQDHSQAVLKLHTGHETLPRPSMGAWVLYGLGTENQNLPGFITLNPTQLNGGPQNYGPGFLPAVYQGTALGNPGGGPAGAQIRHIRNGSMSPAEQREQLDLLQEFNRAHLTEAGADTQIEAVIESYEMAFRMQSEAPQLTDLSGESKATLDLYGINQNPTDGFGRQCLLARRFAEKGVRFIQASHSFRWDQHINLKRDLERNALEVDRPIAALLTDLRARGMLDETLVVWGGEFGRTPSSQANAEDGRDHNPDGFCVWVAGGGIKPGLAYGSTDDYGFKAAENRVHLHDLHATLLHLLGIDHERLTFRHAGRDYRLTDVHGTVVKALLA